jgi:hypothetical protein
VDNSPLKFHKAARHQLAVITAVGSPFAGPPYGATHALSGASPRSTKGGDPKCQEELAQRFTSSTRGARSSVIRQDHRGGSGTGGSDDAGDPYQQRSSETCAWQRPTAAIPGLAADEIYAVMKESRAGVQVQIGGIVGLIGMAALLQTVAEGQVAVLMCATNRGKEQQ